jgi:hypothetical protein
MWTMLILALAMQPTPPSSVVIISKEAMSQVDEPKQVAVRSAAEWSALWRQHAGDSKPPAVDLNTRTVVAVFLGSRRTSGYSVEIVGTRESGGGLVVQWQERSPGRDMMAAQVITSPAIIASIPRFVGPITFEKVDK